MGLYHFIKIIFLWIYTYSRVFDNQVTMWKVLFLVLYFSSVVRSDQKKPLNSIYVNAVRCNYSEKYVYKNVSCFAKSYSRTFSSINIRAIFKKKMNFYVIL